MTNKKFFEQMDARIAKYDLLCHPFYKAWSAGELTREEPAGIWAGLFSSCGGVSGVSAGIWRAG